MILLVVFDDAKIPPRREVKCNICYEGVFLYFCRLNRQTMEELKTFPLFNTCTDEELQELLQSPHRREEYVAGDLVVNAGTPCRSLMLLAQGTVETRMGGANGREVVIEQMRSPTVLAPAFLFAEDNTIPVEVSMRTDGVVWYINREAFFNFMTQHPHVLRAFLQTLSARSRFLSGKVKGFAVKGLRDRVLDHIRKHDTITNVSETAEQLGVARPSLSRVLAELQADGLVERINLSNNVKAYRAVIQK